MRARPEARDITDLNVDELAAVERAEKSLDRFINQRSRGKREGYLVEAAWLASERRAVAARREANRLAWIDYHRGLRRSHLQLAREHSRQAHALELPELAEQGSGEVAS